MADTIKEKYGNSQVIAKYSGGTKIMSVVLALVGKMTDRWDLSFNIASRQDLIRVRSGNAPVVKLSVMEDVLRNVVDLEILFSWFEVEGWKKYGFVRVG